MKLTALEYPWMILITPGGKPASLANSASIMVAPGSRSRASSQCCRDGSNRSTPERIHGGDLRSSVPTIEECITGNTLKGKMAATTPRGSL
ncbi:hypothetical protein BDV09DRAFT_168428 [Aspergillus tetrazonus]